jgi:hypothetical protein
MAYQNTHRGIIVVPAVRATALADELIALCDWPVLAQPSLRALTQHIDLHHPLCLLFWLETASDVSPAAALVARLRDRGPRPYRIAVAHCLDQAVEHTLRSAGVHSYFADGGNLRALIEDTLLPFVELQRGAVAQSRSIPTAEVPIRIHTPSDSRGSPASMHPP